MLFQAPDASVLIPESGQRQMIDPMGINVLNSQSNGLHDPQPAAIQQFHDQLRHALQKGDNLDNLLAGSEPLARSLSCPLSQR